MLILSSVKHFSIPGVCYCVCNACQGGLVAGLVVGWLVLGRRYSLVKCVSVMMITLGTFLATLASANFPVSQFSAKISFVLYST